MRKLMEAICSQDATDELKLELCEVKAVSIHRKLSGKYSSINVPLISENYASQKVTPIGFKS